LYSVNTETAKAHAGGSFSFAISSLSSEH